MKILSPSLLFLLILCTYTSSAQAQQLEFKESEGGIMLTEEGSNRFFYQTATKTLDGKYPRANYVHPLYGNNGELLTEDFPEDHYHHRGIFWTWHQLYVSGKRIADPWFCEGISWKVTQTSTQVKGSKAWIKATVQWLADSLHQAPVMEEEILISFSRIKDNAYTLTFDISLSALVEGLSIGGSEDAKGYGGFSPRIKLPDDLEFHSQGKEISPQNLPVQAGPWMDMQGSYDGQNQSGLVIMGEPAHLPNYQGWILRSANSMQNMAFPGQQALSIPKGQSLDFRNMILVYENLSPKQIEKIYKDFAKKRD
ncbi:hypothetical protein GCM10007049_26130 [Echinicola pacifica]|uniref:Methane oxygenase PmoA n=1 Tax=Echinicola pacifica TaxID=346377 RepID=A0A918Q4M9_9BACT|nr:DUF6807 family protein [Echinicola pacifica]GGZ31663.1 hypothetical protein GCM10007049_26130 [Echinicola pacifica]